MDRRAVKPHIPVQAEMGAAYCLFVHSYDRIFVHPIVWDCQRQEFSPLHTYSLRIIRHHCSHRMGLWD